MNPVRVFRLVIAMLTSPAWLAPLPASAATNYVWQSSPSPAPPFDDWSTAAHTIQEALDAAAPGDEILVTNGVYQSGARELCGMSNRVAVTKPVTVRSVNGPEATHILGAGPVGPTAVRCVFLANGALLAGFTLTNGATQNAGDWLTNYSGGAVWCEGLGAVVSNCTLTGNSAHEHGGGAYSGTLIDCTISGNSAYDGGGAYSSTLTHCVLTGNSAGWTGGGAWRGALTDCTLADNLATYEGGGAWNSSLERCVLRGNTADFRAGGAWNSILNDCVLTGNSASTAGGGAAFGTLSNCTLTSNSAYSGGGVYRGVLNDCTLAGNSATFDGGGAWDSSLNGCVLTGNSAYNGGGASYGALNHCAVSSNSVAGVGGGVCSSTLTNCVLAGNSAGLEGGGASSGTLSHCTISGNSASESGGGASGCSLDQCTLTGNSAQSGGGAFDSTLYNCVLRGNTADNGGGTCDAILKNCTLAGNSANNGGGVWRGALDNCIVYYNAGHSGYANYGGGTFKSCCTTPLPTGAGNQTNAPSFLNTNGWSDLRLRPDSPCIDAGADLSALIATDLAGLPRPLDGNGDGLAAFDMGACEFNPYSLDPTCHISPSGFHFTVRGEPGRAVRIEKSVDLLRWEPLTTTSLPITGQTLVDPAATNEPRLFYRTVRLP